MGYGISLRILWDNMRCDRYVHMASKYVSLWLYDKNKKTQ